MRITCFIDSLNSGGAQRQISMLAVLLSRQGFEVKVLLYHQLDFFQDVLSKENIPVEYISSKNKYHRFFAVRKAIRESQPDVVIAFLNSPSLLAEFSGLPSRRYKLIVSERNTEFNGVTFKCFRRFLFHTLADKVVTNSHAQGTFIEKTAPWLRPRLATIINCVDLEAFHPPDRPYSVDSSELRLLVLGRLENQKNPLALLCAIKILKKSHPKLNLVVDWYGNNFFQNGTATQKSDLYLQLQKSIEDDQLEGSFRLHPPVKEVINLYWRSSALCLPSLWEGCSNVICEAIACGKPVLASRAGDNDILVKEGENGFLFNPKSPDDIARTILRFATLSVEERSAMGAKSRSMAESMLSTASFVKKYMECIDGIMPIRSVS